jgi:hypothetical protein
MVRLRLWTKVCLRFMVPLGFTLLFDRMSKFVVELQSGYIYNYVSVC